MRYREDTDQLKYDNGAIKDLLNGLPDLGPGADVNLFKSLSWDDVTVIFTAL